MGFHAVLTHDNSRVANYRTVGWHILAYHTVGPDSYIVTNGDATKHYGTRVDADMIAYDRTAHLGVVAQRHQLQTVEIRAYALGIEIGGIVVLEVAPGTNVATPNVESALGWQ